jgi:hypothetical protein
MEVYDFPFLALIAVCFAIFWGLIYLALKLLKHKCNEGFFLISFKIVVLWLFHVVIACIVGGILEFKTSSLTGFVLSIILSILSSILCAALVLRRSMQSEEIKSILQKTQAESFSGFVKTSAITFVFATIGMTVLFGSLYLVANEIEKRNPKPSVQFGLYDI